MPRWEMFSALETSALNYLIIFTANHKSPPKCAYQIDFPAFKSELEAWKETNSDNKQDTMRVNIFFFSTISHRNGRL